MKEDELMVWTLAYAAAIIANRNPPKVVADIAVDDYNQAFIHTYETEEAP